MTEKTAGFLDRYREPLVVSIIALAVLVIYAQTIRFDFINLDDNLYVFNNQTVLSGLNKESIRWAFTQFFAANWHPLTWLSHMLDVQLFGQNPGAHHAVNVILHLANSMLAFSVFRVITGSFWRSAIVAVLFAVHPAHVESVAWVAERKDVLSTFLWLLTMLAYAFYARRVSSDSPKPFIKRAGPAYLLVFVLLAFGLMAKPMLVTLPCVLLLLDLWPLGRLNSLRDAGRLVAEKIPLFALSAASSYVTFLAQRSSGSVETLDYLPIATRLVNALLSVGKYTAMLFYPANLGVWYPYDRNFPTWQIVVSAIFFLAMTSLSVWQFRRRKYLTVGWLWFLGTLVPVIGLVQVGSQPMADRYTYVPYFGLFIILVWGAADLFRALALPKAVFFAVFGAFVLGLTPVAFNQTTYWKNNEILYKRTLAVTEKNFLISHNLCHHLILEDRLDEAESFCRQSIADKPDYFEAYNTYGILLIKRREYAAAEEQFKRTLELRGDYAIAYANIAVAQALLGKPEEAEANLEKAVRLSGDSASPSTWINTLRDVALAYGERGNYEKAADNLKRILFIDPNNMPARANLALAFCKLNRFDEALQVIEPVAQSNYNDAAVYNAYGLALLGKNRKTDAAEQFEKALKLKPDFTEAKENLKKARGEK